MLANFQIYEIFMTLKNLLKPKFKSREVKFRNDDFSKYKKADRQKSLIKSLSLIL